MLILDFAVSRSSEKFEIDIRIQLQNVERFKRSTQQTFKKFNFERSRVESSSD